MFNYATPDTADTISEEGFASDASNKMCWLFDVLRTKSTNMACRL